MQVLVVGLGGIARRHIRNLKQLEPDFRITVLRRQPGDLGDIEVGSLIDSVVFSLEEALETNPDIALLTNPAPFHIGPATHLAEQGIHLFIEKPLSDSLVGVDHLLDVCEQKSLVLMIGYGFRLYEPLARLRDAVSGGRIGRPVSFQANVGQYLPDWRPSVDYRTSVSAQSELGGGALLELSHELDYARWFMGEVKSVAARCGSLSDLDLDVEDVADVVLDFGRGSLGNIHLDMVARAPHRTCRVVGTEGVATWTWEGHRSQLFEAGGGGWAEICSHPDLDFNEVFLSEMRCFVACVRGGARPPVDGDGGRKVLEIALAAKRASQEARSVTL